MDNLKPSNMLTVYLVAHAMPSLIRDCKVNGIQHKKITRGTIHIADTPKGRTAIQMVKMNYGLQSIRIAN